MPIKGLTDRGVAFPQIGNIRKGAVRTQDDIDHKRPGKDLPHFRVEFDERETRAIAKFNQLYPDGKPTAITILLPFDRIESVWNPWREAYIAGALLHRCDGEFVYYAIDAQTGAVLVKNGVDANGQAVKCALQNDPDKRKRCKPTGRLHVIVPELERLAYLVVHTTSIHDIGNISDQLSAIREMNGGHIVGIPLVLRRRPVKISTPDDQNGGKRAWRVKYLISIEADPEWVSRKIGALKLAALPQLQQIAAPKDKGPSLEDLSAYEVEPDEDEESNEPIIDGEVTNAPQPQATGKPMYRIASVKFNGLKPDRWHEMCAEFSANHPNWQKDGRPDMNHILASAGHAGYQYITSDNANEMFKAIVEAHETKAQP